MRNWSRRSTGPAAFGRSVTRAVPRIARPASNFGVLARVSRLTRIWYNRVVRFPVFVRASVSALRLFRPVFAASLLITVLTAGLTLVVNPAANGEFQRQVFRIVQARAASGLQERVFNSTFGDVTIYVEDVSTSQVGLRGILV